MYLLLALVFWVMGALTALCSFYAPTKRLRYYYLVSAAMTISGGIICFQQ